MAQHSGEDTNVAKHSFRGETSGNATEKVRQHRPRKRASSTKKYDLSKVNSYDAGEAKVYNQTKK